MMADFAGPRPSPEIRRLIERHHLGGVILFEKNVESPRQAAALCAALQDLARRAGSPPLLIAVDQEGGPVERLPLRLPGAMALGATRSAALARAAGRAAGRALRAVGCTVDFAPVLDVNSNPANPIIGIRSFGEEPALVAELGSAFAAGLRQEGVAATGKHFPGHGDADLDSHLDLPVVAHGRERLEAVEFLPFRQAADAGLDALMTAHVAFPSFDALPATLSPLLLEGLLRRVWRFEGVVFTDSFSMAPIREQVGAGPAAVLALLAGADVLLALGGAELQDEVLAAVRQAVAAGVLSVERLRRSYARVERLRAGAAGAPPADAVDSGAIPGPEVTRLAEEIAEQAVTVVRRAPRMIPLPDGPLHVVTLLRRGGTPGTTLGEMLRRQDTPLREVVLGPEERWDEAAAGRGTLVVATDSHGRPVPWQVEVVRRARQAAGERLVVVASGTPYDLAYLPPVDTYLATYGREPALLAAAARVLRGTLPPRGRLPVTIPGHATVGGGLVW